MFTPQGGSTEFTEYNEISTNTKHIIEPLKNKNNYLHLYKYFFSTGSIYIKKVKNFEKKPPEKSENSKYVFFLLGF